MGAGAEAYVRETGWQGSNSGADRDLGTGNDFGICAVVVHRSLEYLIRDPNYFGNALPTTLVPKLRLGTHSSKLRFASGTL